MSENKDRFVSLVRSIDREGINELVEFLENRTFTQHQQVQDSTAQSRKGY